MVNFLMLLLILLPQIAAAPADTQNMTALKTQYAPAWVPEPNSRGTWSLVYSCIFTLALCVYTAIHLNIPAPAEHPALQTLRRVKWGFVAIFAPEISVFTAWQQWCWARRISKELEALKFEAEKKSSGSATSSENLTVASSQPCEEANTESETSTGKATTNVTPSGLESKRVRSKSFSLVYGFYAVMGGFTVDVSDMHDSFSRLTLTAPGVIHLANLGLFKEISDREILDKSKANNLGKGLVILQVTWMILQCISRKAAGFPLTVLEIHTLVHACCALIMYALWFCKPLDIQESTPVNIAGFEKEIALMLIMTPGLCSNPNRVVVFPKESKRPEMQGHDHRPWLSKAASEASLLAFCAQDARRDSPDLLCEDFGIAKKDLGDVVRFVIKEKTRKSNTFIHPNETEGDGTEVIPSFQNPEIDVTETPATESLPTFYLKPPPGIQIVGSLETGEFMGNGIGPSTFAVGSLQNILLYDFFPDVWPFNRWTSLPKLPKPVELPIPFWYGESPAGHANFSRRYNFKLSISLSQKDIKRYITWQLQLSRIQKITPITILRTWQNPMGAVTF